MKALAIPNLRLARRRLRLLVAELPSAGPGWHPTFALALELRRELQGQLAKLDAYFAEAEAPAQEGRHGDAHRA